MEVDNMNLCDKCIRVPGLESVVVAPLGAAINVLGGKFESISRLRGIPGSL